MAWGDYDNDGDLDILLTGTNTNNVNVSKVYTNTTGTANTAPSAPFALAATPQWNTTALNGKVTLCWLKPADAQTPQKSLTCNVRIGTGANGVNSAAPMANVATGYRHVVQNGRTLNNTLVFDSLPEGTYYWSVQAIDQAYAGSAFATEGSFVVSSTQTGPTAPVATAATDRTTESFTANWQTAAGATSYLLEVATDEAFTQITTTFSGITDLYKNITGLNSGTAYYYRVRSVSEVGASVYSNTISATTLILQAVTFGEIAAKTYGDAPFTVSATGGTSGNPVTFTSSNESVATCSGTNGATITIMGAGECSIYANQSGNETHANAAQVSQALAVGKKSIVVTADAKTKVYGHADPVLTYTYTPELVDDDTFSGNIERTAGEGVGTYPISIGTLTAGTNYIIGYTSGVFTITSATGIDTEEPADISVYPNPVITELNIECGNTIKGVRIFDIIGQIVYANAFSSEQVKLDFHSLKSGVYIIEVETSKGKSQMKVLKH